jgi:hypothetical protein
MLFIDGVAVLQHPRTQGTGLSHYPSFGKQWQHDTALIILRLTESLQDALLQQQVSASRPAEIVHFRLYVLRDHTSPNSYRYKMYEDEGGNYDVHMMETVGRSRKMY